MKAQTAIVTLALASGCAGAPDVTLTYYHAKWSANVTVVQSVICNGDNSALIALPAATVTPVYAADIDKPRTLKVRALDRWYSDSELTMGFTEDGRLKSINQSSAGQGEALVKAAVGLAVTAKSAIKLSAVPTLKDACDFITKWTGGKGPATITYRTTIDGAKLPKTPVLLSAAAESEQLHDALGNFVPKLEASIGEQKSSAGGPSYTDSGAGVVEIELQRVGSIEIKVSQNGGKEIINKILIPQEQTYKVPIPKAKFWGKQGFTLAVAESGAVTSIGYVKNVGATGALNALGSIAGMDTASAKAAELKAEADLIAQQQRLAICQAKPSDCK